MEKGKAEGMGVGWVRAGRARKREGERGSMKGRGEAEIGGGEKGEYLFAE
jgi:hypothetical protein